MPELVFTPRNSEFVPADIPALVQGLQDSGFIGRKWDSPAEVKGQRYLIGDAFLSLISFMGCAPAIELAPLDDDPTSTDFCHVEFEPVREKVEFIAGTDSLISRCPHCRQRHASWDAIPRSLHYNCDGCGKEVHLADFDWKQGAGCGRFFISLHGIYPQEAIPTPNLMQQLEKLSGQKWTYFYIHHA